MCLLIHAKDASLVPDDHIKSAWRTNSDGFGIWYVDNGMLMIQKDVFNHADDVLEFWHSRYNLGEVNCHFRMATHGTRNQENAHPYIITTKEECGRDIVLGHNGVLYRVNAKSTHSPGNHPSDSRIFAEEYLRPLLLKKPHLIDDEDFRKLVGDAIGSGNKLLITVNGDDDYGSKTFIINESSGSWNSKNAWYSNQYSIGNYHYHSYYE